MNRAFDIDLVLREYLAEDDLLAPDRVLDSVEQRIARQPRLRAGRLHWRLNMHPLFKYGIAAAAVLLIAVVGYNLLPGRPSTGVPATPTPGSTAGPSPSPLVPRSLSSGALQPGVYLTQPFIGAGLTSRVTFTLPAGWSGFPNWGLLGPVGTGTTGGIGIGFLTADGLFSDPCHWDAKGDGSWPQRGNVVVGPTVDDLVTALVAHAGYTATTPTAVTLNGHTGKKVDLHLPSDVDLSKCDKVSGNAAGAYLVWGTADTGGNDLYLQGPGQRWQLWILDITGQRVVIVVDDYANTSEQDRAAALAIVSSVQITP